MKRSLCAKKRSAGLRTEGVGAGQQAARPSLFLQSQCESLLATLVSLSLDPSLVTASISTEESSTQGQALSRAEVPLVRQCSYEKHRDTAW